MELDAARDQAALTSARYPSGTGPPTSFSAISKTIELLAVDAAAFAAVEKDNLELRGPDEARRCSAHAFHVRLGSPGYRLAGSIDPLGALRPFTAVATTLLPVVTTITSRVRYLSWGYCQVNRFVPNPLSSAK